MRIFSEKNRNTHTLNTRSTPVPYTHQMGSGSSRAMRQVIDENRRNSAVISLRRELQIANQRIASLDGRLRVAQNTSEHMRKICFAKKQEAVREDESECSLCMDAEACVALIPCGHVCMCEVCINNLFETPQCPLCRSEVHQVQRVFGTVPRPKPKQMQDLLKGKSASLSSTWA